MVAPRTEETMAEAFVIPPTHLPTLPLSPVALGESPRSTSSPVLWPDLLEAAVAAPSASGEMEAPPNTQAAHLERH